VIRCCGDEGEDLEGGSERRIPVSSKSSLTAPILYEDSWRNRKRSRRRRRRRKRMGRVEGTMDRSSLCMSFFQSKELSESSHT